MHNTLILLIIIIMMTGCGLAKHKPAESPRSYLEEHHELTECYTVTGNGLREKFLINNHPKRTLLVRSKTVFKVAGRPQRGDGKISEHIIPPGEKINVGCEGWGMDSSTQLYSIYRQNVARVFFLRE